ncbi:MAG TPA: sigma-70 family RNA polymerase sigma factor [Polyangia bacterium]|nr:sigma-70 family RNA polymerase sigma factor [Polyangia bacterium]
MQKALKKRTAGDRLEGYLAELKNHPLLSREEEHVLAERYRATGDLDAARRLVTANLRLVVKLAHEYKRAHHDLLDLVQEGNLGLLQALEKFDPTRGIRFPSYAAWWIRAYVLRHVVNDFSLVKIGTSPLQRKLFFNLKKEKRKLEAAGFVPTSSRLALALGAPEREVIDMDRRLTQSELRLDAPAFKDDGESRTRLDELTGDDDERPDNAVEAGEFRARLRDTLASFGATVSGREKTIFDERLLSEQPKSLTEIGAAYGISRERARQIEKQLLGRLKKYLRRQLGDAVEISPANDDGREPIVMAA